MFFSTSISKYFRCGYEVQNRINKLSKNPVLKRLWVCPSLSSSFANHIGLTFRNQLFGTKINRCFGLFGMCVLRGHSHGTPDTTWSVEVRNWFGFSMPRRTSVWSSLFTGLKKVRLFPWSVVELTAFFSSSRWCFELFRVHFVGCCQVFFDTSTNNLVKAKWGSVCLKKARDFVVFKSS